LSDVSLRYRVIDIENFTFDIQIELYTMILSLSMNYFDNQTLNLNCEEGSLPDFKSIKVI